MPQALPHLRSLCNRFEFKYLIDEAAARDVREFARSRLIHDEFAQPDLKYAYPTHSLYLDGPGLPLYHSSMAGHKNRMKLRVRFYDEHPASPVFFEIKRRVQDTIIKERALVHRDRAMLIIRGRAPLADDLVTTDNPEQWHALRRFAEFRDRLAATPRALISYLREAWVKPDDDHVRLTFDRDLQGDAYAGQLLAARGFACPPMIAGAPVILELKFTDRFPHWYRDMTQSLNLERRSMAKYCQVAALLAQHAPR